MKKNMNMPAVRIVRFEAKDIIVTSPTQLSVTEVTSGNIVASTQERHNIWED